MMKRKEFMLGATFGLVLAAGATAGGVIDWPTANAGPVSGVSGRLAPKAGPAGLFAPPQGAPLSFADIFQQVAPAVVQIDVTTRSEAPEGGFIQIPGLGAVPVPSPEEGEEGGIEGRGSGSGFFISADGHIVTNNHVVENATEITVRLTDDREFDARVVGRDEATDLAVLKIEGSGFPFVEFEEDAQPRVGDWVIAVGNPFQLGGTATAGIVSGLGRQNIDPESNAGYVDFLQIDAAINTGNSGGPTFDIYGRVIGVNSAILTQTGGSVGVGFAIPASVAKPITEQLMRNGRIDRGYVGLGLRTFSGDEWEVLGLPRDFKGAYVESVTEGGPADRAGVQTGDLLVGVNGETIADGTEATRRVAAARPNETIRLEIIRDNRRRTINVRSGTRPPESELRNASTGGSTLAPDRPPESGQVVEGLTVMPVTPAVRSRYSLPDDAAGLLVTNVARGVEISPVPVRAGMLITRANNQIVTSAGDLQSIVEAARRAQRPGVLLSIRLGNQTGTTILRFERD